MTKPRGAGCVRRRQLKSGAFKYDALIRENGKQILLHACDSEAEAEGYLQLHAIRRAAAGYDTPRGPGVMTLRELGRLYLNALPYEKLATDQSRWRRVEAAEFIDWPVTELTPAAIRRWVDKQARTPVADGKSKGKRPARSTLQNALNLLRGCLRWAVIQGHLDQNPARDVTIHESTLVVPHTTSVGEIFDYLREDEARKLFTAPNIPLAKRTAFVLLAMAGARPKDVRLLTWQRVWLAEGWIRFRSHKKRRDYDVHLLPPAQAMLRAWWESEGRPEKGLVFPGRGKREHAKGYDWSWADIHTKRGRVTGYGFKILGRHVPLYSLRHTCASLLLLGAKTYTGGRRWSHEEIASHLGHTDLTTVKRYAVALGVAARQAVEESRALLLASESSVNGELSQPLEAPAGIEPA